MARSKIDPRSEFEKAMHVNEQTPETLKFSLTSNFFDAEVNLDDYFVMQSSPSMFLYYLVAQPFYLPWLKNFFAEHLWAVARKINAKIQPIDI